jgi:hypothetical protein
MKMFFKSLNIYCSNHKYDKIWIGYALHEMDFLWDSGEQTNYTGWEGGQLSVTHGKLMIFDTLY